MDISIKWNVCRVCLLEEKQGIPSKTVGFESVSQMKDIFNDCKLSKQIFDCSGVVMRRNDNLPQKICKKCLTVLRFALTFRKTCRNSDKYLQMVIQKAKSATSLFQMKKPRKDAIDEELVDDVMDEVSEEEIDVCDDFQTNNNNRKRRRTSWSSTNKAKVDTNVETLREHEEEPDKYNATEEYVASAKLSPEDNDHDSHKLDVRSTDELLQDLTGEGDIDVLLSDSESINNEENLHEKREAAIKVKKESESETHSEFSIELASVDDDGGEIELRYQNLTEKEYENNADTTVMSPDINSVNGESVEHLNEEVNASPDDDLKDNDRGFFYIISDVIKIEKNADYSNNNDLDTVEQPQYIEVGDELKSESFMAEETVEYLIDSTDEQTQSASDHKYDLVGNSTKIHRTRKERSVRKSIEKDCFHVCEICGNHFKNRNLLNFHMKMHRNEKKFECELCFKRFNAACNLSAHMRIHTGEKPYQCQFCDRRFSDRSTHIKHERIHTNEKPYSCTTCGKAFSLSTSLKAHEKIHTGEKPYRCIPCARSFKLPHQLKAHQNTYLHKLLSSNVK